MKNILFIFASYFSLGFTIGQQTVGLFSINDSVEDGYVLFGPKYNNTTYLIDNCGNLQFSWNSNYKAGGSVKLLPNGNLIRSCVFENNSPIVGGGAGGRIECIKPNQLIEWSINLSNDSIRQHHDYEILPNGNIIMIIWELKSLEEAISEGRDSSLITASGLWVDYIIEYSPDLDSIVWEWHTWDHLIQNYDSTKPNYGHPTIHDELFDLNFSANGDEPDWQHLNSIDYNDSLDLILLCSPFWNEIYFIDHSTTMFEASSHLGGNYGKGGDILWRWGNPITYGAGDSTNQKFFGQHDAHWIDAGKPDAGKIIIFNNGKNKLPSPHSSVNIISHPVYHNNQFSKNSYGVYLPDSFFYEFLDTTNMNFYSKLLSSADQLGNGNILINEGVKGHFFEISKNGDIVWDYISPVVSDSTMTQGVTIPGNSSMLFNASFRARKIHPDFNGLNALPLVNHGPIELNPINTPCSLSEIEEDIIELSIFPNPSSDIININLYGKNSILEIYSIEGNKILEQYFNYQTSIDVTNLPHGIYIVQITNENKRNYTKFVKN